MWVGVGAEGDKPTLLCGVFPRAHLDHVELGDAVLVHAHRHGYAVLFDEHGGAWRWRRGKRAGEGGIGVGGLRDGSLCATLQISGDRSSTWIVPGGSRGGERGKYKLS